MGVKLTNAVSIEEMDDYRETASTTQVADWVINLNLTPEAHRLYMKLCLIAKDEDASQGLHATLSIEEADDYTSGKGLEALSELIKAGALRQIAKRPEIRSWYFKIQEYPPDVAKAIGRYTKAAGLPLVNYG